MLGSMRIFQSYPPKFEDSELDAWGISVPGMAGSNRRQCSSLIQSIR